MNSSSFHLLPRKQEGGGEGREHIVDSKSCSRMYEKEWQYQFIYKLIHRNNETTLNHRK